MNSENKNIKNNKDKKVEKTEGIITRKNTVEGINPLDAIKWKKCSPSVFTEDGSKKFNMDDVEAPEFWSDLAIEIFASKYFKVTDQINDGKGERSIRKVIERVCNTLGKEGVAQGYFKENEAEIFKDELAYLLVNQMASFNSPVWFNCGLHEEYGIEGTNVDNYRWDSKKNTPVVTKNYYENPQLSACFIQSIDDNLQDIWEHVGREMKIFKGGSGSGTDYSSLRSKGEPLSSGGTSSGVISFLRIFDRAAASTKSGGTNRRAAKMATLDASHPEILDFVRWKSREEEKAQMLIDAGLPADYNGEAYETVSGQNSNNSVRVSDEFMSAVQNDEDWELKSVTKDEVVSTVKAKDLFKEICEAAWKCADPGLQFSTTINKWHTCPRSGEIKTSNPCSEFLFIDNSACNLASINIVKFLNNKTFDVKKFKHACAVMILAQDIIIDYGSYPTATICENSHNFRPVGLGVANVGGYLMRIGIPYDSEQGRMLISTIISIMTATSYVVSAKLAEMIEPFALWRKNKVPMQKVVERHRRAAISINDKMVDENLYEASMQAWDEVVALSKKNGFRNSQVTLAAPTGTISFIMDVDTTGIEPEYALVKIKRYAGGGFSKIVNQSVHKALKTLGYNSEQIKDIKTYMVGNGKLPINGNPGGISVPSLKSFGFTDEMIEKINNFIPKCLDVDSAMMMVEEVVDLVGKISNRKTEDFKSNSSLLYALGFSEDLITEVNNYSCGHMCIEGAPHIKQEHMAVFDCANTCGPCGKRFISSEGHLNMLSSLQPFFSGGMSKTLNLPEDATSQDIWDVFMSAWMKGIKCITVYRDGCKASQPLSSKSDKEDEDEHSYMQKRKRMPMQREGGKTLEVKIGGHKIFLTANPFEDGSLGEVFILAKKPSSSMGGLLHCFARMTSLALQYGVPLEKLVQSFTYEEFEPSGLTTHPNITQCKSIVDFVFRWLSLEYLKDDTFAQIKPSKNDDDNSISVNIIEETPQLTNISQINRPSVAGLCSNCGSSSLKRTGTCLVCEECGTSQGCS